MNSVNKQRRRRNKKWNGYQFHTSFVPSIMSRVTNIMNSEEYREPCKALTRDAFKAQA